MTIPITLLFFSLVAAKNLMVSDNENFKTISTLAVVETLAIEDLNSTRIFLIELSLL